MTYKRLFRLSFLATGVAFGAVEATRMRQLKRNSIVGEKDGASYVSAEKVCVFSLIEVS